MKNYTPIIIGLVVIILFAVTNPSREEHKQTIIREVLKEADAADKLLSNLESENSYSSKAGSLIGSTLAVEYYSRFLDNSISIDNFIICSLGSISLKGEDKTLTFGILGNTFFLPKSKLDPANWVN